MTACRRCGHHPQAGTGDFLATLAVTVNDISQVARVLLCDRCRVVVRGAVDELLRPVGEAAGW